MGLEELKKLRSGKRRFFTLAYNRLDAILQQPVLPIPLLEFVGNIAVLDEAYKNLVVMDEQVHSLLLPTAVEEDIQKDCEEVDGYNIKYHVLKCRAQKIVDDTNKVHSNEQPKKHRERNYQLPKLEMTRFDGNIKNWLFFWAQFKKVDSDENIDASDKLAYLLQAMEPGSEVRRFVQNFPPTGNAYNDCVEQLKARYAKDEVLIQVYVRELLSIVLMRNHEGYPLSKLYDSLNLQLRALDTLGVTKDKFAAFLLPMVESALPQELLKVWERTKKSTDNITDELSDLLTFLRKEVEVEQRIDLTRHTFDDMHIQKTDTMPTQDPTAGCLLANSNIKKLLCIWCDKESHNSFECYKLQKMSLNDRKEFIKNKKACSICLRRGHHARSCKTHVKCIICGQRHAVVLCSGQTVSSDQKNDAAKSNRNNREMTKVSIDKDKNDSLLTNISTAPKKMTTTFLQTVSVVVCYGGKEIIVRAMFDSGSQRSYIKNEIASQLGLSPVSSETLSHALFGGVELKSNEYDLYNVKIYNLDKTFSLCLNVLGQKCICRNIPIYTKDITHLLGKHNITLSDNNQSDDIGLLIGADFSGLLLTGSFVNVHEALVAVKTKLGWTLQGRATGTPIAVSNISNTLHCSTDNELSNFWCLENIGIRDPIEVKNKKEKEEEVLKNFEEEVRKNDEGRYEVSLPWKVGHDILSNNFELTSRRLESVTKKLKTNNLFTEYDKVIKDWHDQNIIETVANPDVGNDCHYLPHRPVIKEKSLTTRIRPVFDASAKDYHGKSLNICLDKGVNLLDKIPKLIIGFRKRAIGITADIAKAFLQVSVSPTDRDMLRFLWWNENSELVTYRHCRVVFGLTSSPFLLSATIQHHLRQVSGDLKKSADNLSDSFYVDNCLTSLDTKDDVKKFELEAKLIMSQAKFDLRQWVIAPSSEQVNDVSVLGLVWHTAEDELGCDTSNLPLLEEIGEMTKRKLLSLAQKIYDPIGFTSAITLTPRLILQESWHRKLNWDEELPSDLKRKFVSWYSSIHNLRHCRIPRRLTDTWFDDSSLQLHMFCDASQYGYGACVYIRAEYNDKVSIRLISAKSRIAPPGKHSIPRLELLGALIGSRLIVEIRKDLKLTCIERYWTDSGVSLCWIKNELPWNTFVGNRVKEIRQNTSIDHWFHIPGKENWADLLSRGCDADQLLSTRWLEGPTWLSQSPEHWPVSGAIVDEVEANRELKKTAVCNAASKLEESITSQFSYFSKYSKIIRTVAWMIRFTYNAHNNNNKSKGELTYEEIEAAEKKIIRIIQQENKEYIEKKINSLTYICDDDDNLFKIKTKLLLTDFPETTKLPVVLPATSFITRRLVEQRHAQLQHAGLGTVMADLRARFWIIGARQLVKSVITNCNVCKRYRAKPTQAPAAPLPIERTQCSAPFEVTGVDLTGPLILRGNEKCWIVLYTCAVYRAVHLELTKSLSTQAFLMTLRRFIARRGRVRIIISDNGTNFVGSKNLLSELDWDEITRQSAIQRIKWKLNAPTAAWWGGFWERLIKILKDLLKRILGQNSVTYEELLTILCDCEATMNSRPLTYIEDEKVNSLQPLTPSYFLQPIPESNVSDLDQLDSKSLNLRLNYIQKLREDFRHRFKTEYLTTLVQRGRERKDCLKIGDVVIVETEDKRLKWPLGIIEELFTGRDNIHRTARVRTSTGSKIRPIQRLYKLEIDYSDIEFLQRQKSAKEDSSISSGEVTELTPPSLPHVDISSQIQGQRDAVTERTARSGRVIKMPNRLSEVPLGK